MNLLLFIIGIFVYCYVCYFFARIYFSYKTLGKIKSRNKLLRLIGEYAFFFVFIFIEIPFAFFFPVWVNDKLIVIKSDSFTTMLFIIFGAIVLVISLSLGYRRSKK